jgi:hypothetical protein
VSTTMEQTDRQVDWPEQIAEVREIGQEFSADVETLVIGARTSRSAAPRTAAAGAHPRSW